MIRKIIQLISNYPLVSARTEEQFYEDMEAFVVHGANTTVNEKNQLRIEINNTVDDINAAVEDITTKTATAAQASIVAQSAANYKGDWSSNYNNGQGYSLAHSVTFTDGFNYVSKINNNTTSPVSKTNTAQWNWIESINPDDYTSAKLLTKIKEVDGTGSGLDADLFHDMPPSTVPLNNSIVQRDGGGSSGFTTVFLKQGKGISQDITNKEILWADQSIISIGWDFDEVRIKGGRILTTTTPIGHVSGSGVGGTAIQSPDKASPITLNKLTGRITLSNSLLASKSVVSFKFFNNMVSKHDIPLLALNDTDGGWFGSNYNIYIVNVSDGFFWCTLENKSTVSLSEAVSFNFEIIKGANS